MTRSVTFSWARKVPDWRNNWSTSVVLPWSTWAMMAILRSGSGADMKTGFQLGQHSDQPSNCRQATIEDRGSIVNFRGWAIVLRRSIAAPLAYAGRWGKLAGTDFVTV